MSTVNRLYGAHSPKPCMFVSGQDIQETLSLKAQNSTSPLGQVWVILEITFLISSLFGTPAIKQFCGIDIGYRLLNPLKINSF